MVSFRSALPLVFAAALVVFEERASTPSCDVAHTIVPRAGREGDGGGAAVGNSLGELKVMMVGNLLIMGSDTRYLDVFFRNPFLAKFFRKSFDYLKPDMLVVLGDISVNGWHLTHDKWLSTVEQFQKILGPFMEIPLHVMLGDRDIGRCSDPDINSIRRMTSSLPGLDSVGCSSFEISNISFLSLNTMALLCGQNNLRFSVEKVIERESSFLQSVSQETTETSNCSIDVEKGFDLFGWRTNTLQPGAGSVLLLHFPLHRKFSKCGRTKSMNERSNNWEKCCCIGSSAYDTVPANATEYIFQALRPRVVFSAHTQSFCDYVHADGTHEISVPPMSWDLTDEPSFVVVKFREGSATGDGAMNSKKLMKILTSRNREEMAFIRQTYRNLYNRDIVHHLCRTQRNNNLAMIAYLRISEPHERDSASLREALFSSCPNINLIVEILCTRSSLELRSIKQTYRANYNSDLDQDIAQRTQGNKTEILRAILGTSRMNGGRPDMSMAMCDAKVIYEAMESGKCVDWKMILSMVNHRSCEQLKAMCHCYRQLYGHDFSKSLTQAKCGELGRELRCVIKAIQSPEGYFSRQLRRALRNSDAHESLVRTIVTRSGIDIIDIKKAFTAKTGWSMESLVRSEFGSTDKSNNIVPSILVELLGR